MTRRFETEERTSDNKQPLAEGVYIDATPSKDEDPETHKQNLHKEIVQALRELNQKGAFPPPYMAIDLAEPKNIVLAIDGATQTLIDRGEPLKIIVSCVQVADLRSITEQLGGRSVVKCNAAIPSYRWFQAANLLLKHCDQKGRLIPFPLDQDDGVIFHMLRVDPREYAEYQSLLQFSTNQLGLKRGFETAARYSYEALRIRGVTELTHDQVDKTLSHVILMADSRIRGVLLHNATRDQLDDEDLRASHYLFY